MLMPLLLGAVLSAVPHDMAVFVTQRGLSFVEQTVSSFVPQAFNLPPVDMEMTSCTATTSVRWLQRDTHVQLDLAYTGLTVTAPNVLRLEVKLSGKADGMADVDLCVADVSCEDHLWMNDAYLSADLFVDIDADGRPRIDVQRFEFELAEHDVDFWLSGCSIDTIGNFIIGMAKSSLIDWVSSELEAMVREQVAPILEEELAGLLQLNGQIDFADIEAKAVSLDLDTNGLYLVGEADVIAAYPKAECIREDAGEPKKKSGAMPNLVQDPDVHLSLAVNLGLVEDALYHAWRRGIACLTDAHLVALGVPFELAPLASQVPGFVPGTQTTLGLSLLAPPTVVGRSGGSGASLSLGIAGLEVVLLGKRPDGSERRIRIVASATMNATVRLDALRSAVVLQVDGLSIDGLSVQDGGLGFDAERLKQVIERRLLEPMLAELGDISLLPLGNGLGGYYLVPRWVDATPSHLAIGVELFTPPTDDETPPATLVTQAPSTVVRPAQAVVRFSGTDDLIPRELLRYAVRIDGVEHDVSGATEVRLGQVGVTRSYALEVSAVDLSDNRDPTPVSRVITVDGIAPSVSLEGETVGSATSLTELRWRMSDDTTPTSQLGLVLTTSRFSDPTNMLSATVVDERQLQGGTTRAPLGFSEPGVYQTTLTVTDGAGNSTSVSAIVTVDESTGCAQAPGASLLLLALLGRSLRRRRA